jgi:hypothetical protein
MGTSQRRVGLSGVVWCVCEQARPRVGHRPRRAHPRSAPHPLPSLYQAAGESICRLIIIAAGSHRVCVWLATRVTAPLEPPPDVAAALRAKARDSLAGAGGMPMMMSSLNPPEEVLEMLAQRTHATMIAANAGRSGDQVQPDERSRRRR